MTIDLGDVSAPPPSGPWSAQVTDVRPVAFVAAVLMALVLGGSAAPAPQVREVLRRRVGRATVWRVELSR